MSVGASLNYPDQFNIHHGASKMGIPWGSICFTFAGSIDLHSYSSLALLDVKGITLHYFPNILPGFACSKLAPVCKPR